jgi:dolichol-phosphate mannosyltransferase
VPSSAESSSSATAIAQENRPSSRRTVTVIAPVYNEEANIPVLIDRTAKVARTIPHWNVEVLLVDDGSKDRSVEAIESLRAQGIGVGLLRFSRNFGHQAAMQAGLAHARGDAVITLDADLQHPPEEIPRMLARLDEGVDVVQMVRSTSVSGSKGLFSRSFYKLFVLLSDSEIVPGGADFRLLSRRVVDVLNLIPEREKFLRGLIPTLGFRQEVMPFEQAERLHGKPAFGFRRSLKLGVKALFDFSTVPLKLAFWGGLLLALASFVAGVVSILVKIFYWHEIVPGYTDIICSILFLCGTIVAAVGVLGRYLMMILEQVRGRPAFIVMTHLSPKPLVDGPAD